jgi:hypothetical protein
MQSRSCQPRWQDMKKFSAVGAGGMRRITFVALLLWAMPAAAQTVAGNLPPDFYPRPVCEKPDKTAIGSTPGVQDQQAMIAYNLKVRNFNKRAEAFNACMKDYTDKAQRDIEVIQATVHAAVAAANQP